MTAYNHSEAPAFLEHEGYNNAANPCSNDKPRRLDATGRCTMMQWIGQIRANARIARGRYRGFATYSPYSASTANLQPPLILPMSPPTWHKPMLGSNVQGTTDTHRTTPLLPSQTLQMRASTCHETTHLIWSPIEASKCATPSMICF